MIIEGKITNVTVFPIVEGKNGKTYRKAEAIVECPAGENYKDVVNVTCLRPFDQVVGSWNDIVFNWSEPVEVKMTVAFKVREYNGRHYQDITAINVERK